MQTLKARVEHGRMKLDVPTKLPDGTVPKLMLSDPGDNLDPEERKKLDDALQAAWETTEGTEAVPAAEVSRRVRGRR
ncbi:MAG: hypothetical protein HY814_02475 [Candidatus Riflebacteria bacterium]|nr:hypothetical protein [Candidatus Riflebacteria bacterium]